MLTAAKRGVRKVVEKLGYEISSEKGQKLLEQQAAVARLRFLQSLHIGTVIDVGAHVGGFCGWVCQIVPDARFYAFEPIQSCCQRMRERLDGKCRVSVFEVALSDHDGVAPFNVSESGPSSSLLTMARAHRELFPYTAHTQQRTVAVRRLDGYRESIDIEGNLLIKLDVQGAEDQVIRGGMSFFEQATAVITEVSFISLYDGQPLFEDIRHMLAALDYDYCGQLYQYSRPDDGLPVFADAVFVRRSAIPSLLSGDEDRGSPPAGVSVG